MQWDFAACLGQAACGAVSLSLRSRHLVWTCSLLSICSIEVSVAQRAVKGPLGEAAACLG